MAELEKILCTDSRIEAAKKINAIVDAMGEGDLANIDLSNLSSAGQAKFDEKAYANEVLKKNQITNCITETPQRIKYTFNNGTFTLLKGSVMIFPHGTTNLSSTYPVGSEYRNTSLKVVDTQFADNKFFVWAEIQKDIVLNKAGDVTGTNNFFFVDSDNATIAWYGVPTTYSGGTVPTSGQCWYDTTNNIINTTSNSFATYINNNFSLPICTFAREAGAITSINQVFNGFGHIGKTVFCDKGVKALIPNGRNADGTLKNIEITTSKVLADTRTLAQGTKNLVLNASTFSYWETAIHDFERNYNINANGGNISMAIIGTCKTDTTTKIVNVEPNLPFRAVDYNDYRTEIDSKVSKSGDTMTGDLTMYNPNTTAWQGVRVKCEHIDTTSTEQVSLSGGRLITYDKNNKIIGYFQTGIGGGGHVYTSLEARRVIDDANVPCIISVNVGKDGKPFTVAPTPPTGDNSTKIATTAWVNTKVNNTFPNYTAGVSVAFETVSGGYTAPSNGYLFAFTYPPAHRKGQRFVVNGVTVPCGFSGAQDDADTESTILPLAKGDVVTLTSTETPRSWEAVFYPCKGV